MKSNIYNADVESLSDLFDWNGYRVFVFSQKNLDKSTNNEDIAFFDSSDNGAVFGVCDGVGGYPMGKDAAELASKTIIEHFHNSGDTIGFLSALENASNKMRDFKVGARTTAAFALIMNEKIKFYSIGDTEIFYTNTRGRVIYYSIPQSPVGYAVEAGLMDGEESLDAPDRNIVSHLLGDESLRFESSSSIDVKKGQTIFIGSDGVFDNLPKEEVITIAAGGSFDESAKKLEALFIDIKSKESWKKNDDISFVMMRKIRS